MLSAKFNGYNVHLIQSVSEIATIKSILSEKVAVGMDTETTGLSYVDDKVVGVCVACGKSYDIEHYRGFYLPLRHIGYNNLPLEPVMAFVQWIIDYYTTWWWNRNFDATMLEKEGIVFPCVGKTNDGQIVAHLVKGDGLPALKDFAQDYCKFQVLHYSDNNAENGSFATTDPTKSFIYAAGDPLITTLTSRKLWSTYQYTHKIYAIDNKFAECMRRLMGSAELWVDKEKVEELLIQNGRELTKVKNEIFAMAGYTFKLNSNVDKAECLSRFVTLTAKTNKGQFKVDKDVLDSINHPIAKLLKKYANLTKFRSTYLQKFQAFENPFKINYQHCNVACLTERNRVVVEGKGMISISHVEKNDRVLTECGFIRVARTKVAVDSTYNVQLSCGLTIEGNAKHPVYVRRKGKYYWKNIGDLTEGDRVVINRTMMLFIAWARCNDLKKELYDWLTEATIRKDQFSEYIRITTLSSAKELQELLAFAGVLSIREGVRNLILIGSNILQFKRLLRGLGIKVPEIEGVSLTVMDDDFTTSVVSKTPTGVNKVYDITLENTHVFLANGIVTHNTGRMSSGTSKGNPYFANMNIQNIPKTEIIRYLHHDDTASLKYRVDDDPLQPVNGKVELRTGSVSLENIEVGDEIKTNKGFKRVVNKVKTETEVVVLEDNGRVVECDPSSYVLVIRKEASDEGLTSKKLWVMAKDVKESDELCVDSQ